MEYHAADKKTVSSDSRVEVKSPNSGVRAPSPIPALQVLAVFPCASHRTSLSVKWV